jgi:hypothetical protein
MMITKPEGAKITELGLTLEKLGEGNEELTALFAELQRTFANRSGQEICDGLAAMACTACEGKIPTGNDLVAVLGNDDGHIDQARVQQWMHKLGAIMSLYATRAKLAK